MYEEIKDVFIGLYFVCMCGNIDFVYFLLLKGVDVNVYGLLK